MYTGEKKHTPNNKEETNTRLDKTTDVSELLANKSVKSGVWGNASLLAMRLGFRTETFMSIAVSERGPSQHSDRFALSTGGATVSLAGVSIQSLFSVHA